MRTILMLSSLLIAARGFAQPLTEVERERAMSELHAGRKLFLDAVTGLSEAQWTFKAGPDRWSVAEVAEHITLAEDFLFGIATRQIMATPAAPDKKMEVRGKDEAVLKNTLDRSRKGQAPEPLVPTHRFATHQAMIDQFKQSRDRAIAYVESTPDELRSHFLEHPVFGPLDAYQWLLFLAAHTERHILQLNEVKANPNFPKN